MYFKNNTDKRQILTKLTKTVKETNKYTHNRNSPTYSHTAAILEGPKS